MDSIFDVYAVNKEIFWNLLKYMRGDDLFYLMVQQIEISSLSKQLKIIKWMKEFHVDLFFKIFGVAINNNHIRIVKILILKKIMDTPSDINKAILYASSLGYYEIIKFILNEQRISPTVQCCYWGKRYALENGHFEVVKLFLSSKEIKN
jgi:hypothetical protein